MDYSGRVNSKKGSGGVADTAETKVHTKRRLKELLTTQVLDLDSDPYVFRNHLGLLECRLCLTTHVSESSYISHLAGRKHQMNLEKRKLLDEKYNQGETYDKKSWNQKSEISISDTPKRSWKKIGKPALSIRKIRNRETLQMGVFIEVKYPETIVEEPFFRIMSYYELSTKNQNVSLSYIDRDTDDKDEVDPAQWQYLVISAEPYENVCIIIPSDREIDRPPEMDQMTQGFWWHWDEDTKEFFLQFLYKE